MTEEQAKSGLDSILASMDRGLDPAHRRMLLTKGLQTLGVLKLDEPKSVTACHPDRALGLLVNACKGVPFLATTIQETIDRAGLKLTEK